MNAIRFLTCASALLLLCFALPVHSGLPAIITCDDRLVIANPTCATVKTQEECERAWTQQGNLCEWNGSDCIDIGPGCAEERADGITCGTNPLPSCADATTMNDCINAHNAGSTFGCIWLVEPFSQYCTLTGVPCNNL